MYGGLVCALEGEKKEKLRPWVRDLLGKQRAVGRIFQVLSELQAQHFHAGRGHTALFLYQSLSLKDT